jgi:hypothetical protein
MEDELPLMISDGTGIEFRASGLPRRKLSWSRMVLLAAIGVLSMLIILEAVSSYWYPEHTDMARPPDTPPNPCMNQTASHMGLSSSGAAAMDLPLVTIDHSTAQSSAVEQH